MSTFTLFFCGTSSNARDYNKKNIFHQGELVSSLAQHAAGIEYKDYMIVDGVGSGNETEFIKFSKSYYGGALAPIFGSGIASNMQHALAVVLGFPFSQGNCETRKRAQKLLIDSKPAKYSHGGFGVLTKSTTPAYDKWLQQAVELSDDLQAHMRALVTRIQTARKNAPITQLNLIGWSRGGVSCFEFANLLNKHSLAKNIKVNVFALDPVPGGVNPFKDYKKLGGNVAHFVGVFAEDERSTGFKARMPELHKKTKYYTTFMPGRHGTLVGNAAEDGQQQPIKNTMLSNPGYVTRDFAYKTLTSWGCQFKANSFAALTKEQLLGCYQIILAKEVEYAKMQSKSYTKLTNGWFGKIDAIQRIKSTNPQQLKTLFLGLAQQTKYKQNDLVNRHHYDVLMGNSFVVKGNLSAFPVNTGL
ncbi:hypothetical protein [Pseudoalteromonas spongiae]|uniref:hypothetical protein n=1 Tax=Pseudoalteromonas spongiae TaxID=298657 RepID=UPI00026CDA85|nr:hypothetical protein [Pseudoalteromonas spongiae]ATC98180.1 hypothetical protein PSPO_a1047 [Pseudoalteromonas spongiae UST010723-006]